jgi:hypothetical protein
MATYCPAGAFAIAGGWESSGADVQVTESYPSQLPGAGAGAWALTVRSLANGPALVVPCISCLFGVTQAHE